MGALYFYQNLRFNITMEQNTHATKPVNLSKRGRKKIRADVLYGDTTVQRLINSIMWEGKKRVAEKIVYNAINIMKADESVPTQMTVSEIFKKIMANVKPQVEVQSRRVRGATYPVPCEVKYRRAEMLALRWIKQGARSRGRQMDLALSRELLDAFNNTGHAVKQKDNTHSSARASRAFAHLGGSR